MVLSRRLPLLVVSIMLSAALNGPVYSQKLLSEGIKDLATQIATEVSKEKKQKIAILPFRELDGKPTILGTYISEELVTDLFMIGGLDIVERTMLDRLIGELKLGQTGIIDPETAKHVGKVAGVDAIVTGSITDLQSYVALNCRLIDAQTGRIFAAAQTKIAKDDDVRKIMGATLPGSSIADGQPQAQRQQPATRPNPALQQERAGNLLFELKGCNLSGKLVECKFLVTNNGEDDNTSLSARGSRLFDGEGNEYHAIQVILGSDSGNYSAATRLATGIPVRAQLSFDGIPPETQHATLLELIGSGIKIQFRNVPLVRP